MAPIFLVGTMRSGTTLLRLILDSHERLAIANESGFLRAVAATKVIPDQHDGDGWYRRFGVSDEHMHERLRAFYDDIFSSWAQSQGKVRWGDKTPFHIDQLPLLNEIFPDAAVVGIVRHPGAVVASQIRRGRDFASAVRSWRRSNLRLVRAATRPPLRDRVTVLRYEDLVGDPEKTLRQLLDFLQEDWSPNLLRHHEVHRERGGSAVAEGGTRRWDPIDANRGSRWTQELSAYQRRVMATATTGLREVFAYDETAALPLGPNTLLSGRDLRARYKAVPGSAFSRTLLPPAATASRRQGARHVAAQVVNLARTDPVYLLRRLPVAVRSRLHRHNAP